MKLSRLLVEGVEIVALRAREGFFLIPHRLPILPRTFTASLGPFLTREVSLHPEVVSSYCVSGRYSMARVCFGAWVKKRRPKESGVCTRYPSGYGMGLVQYKSRSARGTEPSRYAAVTHNVMAMLPCAVLACEMPEISWELHNTHKTAAFNCFFFPFLDVDSCGEFPRNCTPRRTVG